MATDLLGYLQELSRVPVELPLEPELKANRQEHDRKIKEQQDLQAGAVLQAQLEPGEGTDMPQEGDLVYVHISIKDESDDLLYSTRSDEGGSGYPIAFRVEKGRRAPRGWEVVVQGMTKGQRHLLRVKPEYGYLHPDCRMDPPPGVPGDKVLAFDMQLVNWYPSGRVRHVGLQDDLYRRLVQEGTGWETPRPPFEVTLHVTACTPAHNGVQMSGFKYFSTNGKEPLCVQLGQGALPPGLEAALEHSARNEVAVYVIPAAQMRPIEVASSGSSSSSKAGGASKCLLPPPPAKAEQVEVEVQVLSLVQVRDMTGTGEVLKRRVKDGEGDFPVDCPLYDTTVHAHFKARRMQDGQPFGDWLYDSHKRAVAAADSGSSSTSEAPANGDAPPLEVDTGCGELPEGVEMCIKLMVPGEVACARCAPRFAYQGRSDAPAGISGEDHVEFEITLVDFFREGHWQNLSMPERIQLAERTKAKANELFKAKKYQYARARYERLIRLLESTRDYESEEEVESIDALKLAVLGNLALCYTHMEDYSLAVDTCVKALRYNPSAKMFFRKGRAESLRGNYEEAAEDLAKAAELDPEVARDVERELAANKTRKRAASEKQKKEFNNFFAK